MFTLDAAIHAAPISLRARAMEAKLEILRTVPLQHISNAELRSYPEHTARRTVGPAAAAAPASPPAATAARGAARGGQRPAHAPPQVEPTPPLPPCDTRTTRKSAVDVQSLWECAVMACREAERPLRPREITRVWKALFPAVSSGTLQHYLHSEQVRWFTQDQILSAAGFGDPALCLNTCSAHRTQTTGYSMVRVHVTT